MREDIGLVLWGLREKRHSCISSEAPGAFRVWLVQQLCALSGPVTGGGLDLPGNLSTCTKWKVKLGFQEKMKTDSGWPAHNEVLFRSGPLHFLFIASSESRSEQSSRGNFFLWGFGARSATGSSLCILSRQSQSHGSDCPLWQSL